MRVGLADDPDVIAAASEIGIDEHLLVGKLLVFWGWVSSHTTDGHASGVTKTWLDRYLCVTGFSDAMQSVGWLEIDSQGLRVPNFEKYLSQGAKTRAVTSDRQTKHRAKKPRKSNAPTVTKALPEKRREEKRREEVKKEPPTPLAGIEFPAAMDTPAVRQATEDWLGHHVNIGKPYKAPAKQMALLFKQHPTAECFVADVEHSIANNYQGLIHAEGSHGKSSKIDVGPGQRHPDDVKGIGEF